MNSSDVQGIPGSVKIGGVILGAGGLAALVWKYHDQAAALLIILIGVVAVIGAVLMLTKVGSLKTRGKAKSFKEDLGTKLRATPGSVTDADGRAKLDDLRRSLQSGMEKLQATGKSLYVLPWYLMVGESGSGKTKAISAAAIALPGFQDPLQGAGGTVNMNWWFTNNGIILDTAGRLMLPEVNTGDNPEWDEFLRTLNRRRPNCPINGLILTIPADALITDTASDIDRKAGDIAYQFNKLQVTLGIRFPVFVLITKSDKILGFREFFESVNQPDEQAQLLGWSNPDKLDNPFRPELVEEHLTKVHEQLVRRRTRLIQDPVHTEDPGGRRLDQVDALYELPEAMVGLAPRLRRYLEPIFVAGPLSSKPLFLRGIYFTSSLQTGEAVDAAMSAIMGQDITKSHGGAVVSEKPYFLKHVFHEKVFKEKGLVTRTTNVSSMKRRRKMAVLGAGFVAVLALTGFTWFSRNKLDRDMVNHVTVWDGVEKWGTDKEEEIVGVTDGRYHGQNKSEKTKETLVQLHSDARQEIPQPVHVPAVFKPVAKLSGDLDASRRATYTALFEGTVLAPVITRARTLMKESTAAQWTPESTEALRQLIALEAHQPLGTGSKTSFSLDGLVPFVLDPANKKADRKLWDGDKQIWGDDLRWVYSPDGANATWPPDALANKDANGPAVAQGVDSFMKYIDAQKETSKAKRGAVRLVADKLTALDKAERDLLALRTEIEKVGGDKWSISRPAVDHWKELRPNVDVARKELDDALKTLEALGWTQTSATDPGLAAFYESIVQGTIDRQLKDYDALLDAIPNQTPNDNYLIEARSKLTGARTAAETARGKVAADEYATSLTALEKMMLCRLPGEGQTERLYELQCEVIAIGDKELPGAAPDQSPADFTDAFNAIGRSVADATSQLDRFRTFVVKDGREWQLCDLADLLTMTISAPRRRSLLLSVGLGAVPDKLDGWIERINAVAAPPALAAIPVTGIDEKFPSAEHDPRRLVGIFKQWYAVTSAGSFASPARPSGTTLVMDYDDLVSIYRGKRDGFKALNDQFVKYWTSGYVADWSVKKDQDWDTLRLQFGTDAKTVDAAIRAFGDLRAQAIALIAGRDPPPPMADADPAFEKKADTRRANWANLPTDPGRARVKLLGMSEAVMAEHYLLLPGQDISTPPNLYEEYWSSLFAAGLESVAKAAELQSKSAFDKLWADYRQFPLAPPSADKETDKHLDELSPQQLEAACALIEQVWGPWVGKAGAAAGQPAAGPIALPGNLRASLQRLAGENVLPSDPAQLKWAKDLRRLQPWLIALRDRQLSVRFSFLRMGEDVSNLSTYYVYGEVEMKKTALVDAKHQSVYNLRFYESPDAQPPEGLLIKGDVPGPIVLALRSKTDGPVEKTIDLARGSWPQLRLFVEVGSDQKDRNVTKLDAKNTWKATFHYRPKENTEQNIDYRAAISNPNTDDELPIEFWNGSR